MKQARISLLLLTMFLTMTAVGFCDKADAYIAQGNAKRAKGDLNGAIADYDRAIELRPNAKFYTQRGLALAAKGDLEAAIADYNRAVEIKPNFVPAYAYRGNAKRAKGDLAGADTDYNTTSEIAKSSIVLSDLAGHSTVPLPTDGEAVVYVYHQMPRRRPFEGFVLVNIYANRDFVGVMAADGASYARLEVPKGMITLTETGAGFNQFADFLPLGSSGPLCQYVDWEHLGEAQQVDLSRCEGELQDAEAKLDQILAAGNPIQEPLELRRLCNPDTQYGGETKGTYIELVDPGSVRYCIGRLRYGLSLLTGDNVVARTEIAVEAGKTYYIEWTLSDSKGFGHGSIGPVDEITGAKATAGLPNWSDCWTFQSYMPPCSTMDGVTKLNAIE